MKLSKAQQAIIDKAHSDIDFARTHTIEEWAEKKCKPAVKDSPWAKWFIEKWGEDAFEKDRQDRINDYAKRHSDHYQEEKNAIVLCTANSRTLKKLEEIGLIEIMYDGHSGVDTIKILNY